MLLPSTAQLEANLCSESRLNFTCKRAKVRDSLQFVVRQFNMEMMLEPRKQIQRLQAVYAKSFKEVAVRRKSFPRNFEVCGREGQDFIECLIRCGHM